MIEGISAAKHFDCNHPENYFREEVQSPFTSWQFLLFDPFVTEGCLCLEFNEMCLCSERLMERLTDLSTLTIHSKILLIHRQKLHSRKWGCFPLTATSSLSTGFSKYSVLRYYSLRGTMTSPFCDLYCRLWKVKLHTTCTHRQKDNDGKDILYKRRSWFYQLPNSRHILYELVGSIHHPYFCIYSVAICQEVSI